MRLCNNFFVGHNGRFCHSSKFPMPQVNKPAFAALAFLVASGVASAADDSAVRRCRTIPDSLARLACYDALPLGVSPAAPSNVMASVQLIE